ncbi:hypothetical protein GHT06_009015 [Daphnia sinensis]|uniref:Transposable element P transposase-like RNase H domain-containing protein n=1 Tax=Daphnia sinensis TaxID=1820382 RepID=A0AAD5PZE7_9CRUS|nr:hypothetical protein GHT06_009015 [Daphnia sinensis]
MKFDGFLDYGEDVDVEKKGKLADYALVLMFRPYRAKGSQPIGVYGGAASSSMLQKLVITIIAALQTVNAIVCNVTWDGHQTEKGVHRLWISGKMESVTSWIDHPTEPNEKITFYVRYSTYIQMHQK